MSRRPRSIKRDITIEEKILMKIYDFNGRKNLCGKKIRRARVAKKLTQDELAARLQCYGVIIERDSISRIESGTRFVADYELKIMSEIFEIPVEWFVDSRDHFDHG